MHTGVIMEGATGYPGYDSLMGKDTATIAEGLREDGHPYSWQPEEINIELYCRTLILDEQLGTWLSSQCQVELAKLTATKIQNITACPLGRLFYESPATCRLLSISAIKEICHGHICNRGGPVLPFAQPQEEQPLSASIASDHSSTVFSVGPCAPSYSRHESVFPSNRRGSKLHSRP
jgi:hypothetical protein